MRETLILNVKDIIQSEYALLDDDGKIIIDFIKEFIEYFDIILDYSDIKRVSSHYMYYVYQYKQLEKVQNLCITATSVRRFSDCINRLRIAEKLYYKK